MRNLLAFFAALLVTFVGLGWYLDWYSFRTAPAPSGQTSFTIDVHTKKIAEDALKAEQKIQQKLAEKVKQASDSKTLSVPAEKPAQTVHKDKAAPFTVKELFQNQFPSNSKNQDSFPVSTTNDRAIPNP